MRIAMLFSAMCIAGCGEIADGVLGKTYSCTIDSSDGWQACSNAIAQAGDGVTVSASGRWSITGTGVTCGPEGYDGNPSSWGDYRTNTNQAPGALLWRIVSAPDYEGPTGSFSAVSAGQIEMRINDSDLGNNHGTMSVTVTIAPAG